MGNLLDVSSASDFLKRFITRILPDTIAYRNEREDERILCGSERGLKERLSG